MKKVFSFKLNHDILEYFFEMKFCFFYKNLTTSNN